MQQIETDTPSMDEKHMAEILTIKRDQATAIVAVQKYLDELQLCELGFANLYVKEKKPDSYILCRCDADNVIIFLHINYDVEGITTINMNNNRDISRDINYTKEEFLSVLVQMKCKVAISMLRSLKIKKLLYE